MNEDEVRIDVMLSALREKDIEITPYSSSVEENKKLISNYISQWVSDENTILSVKEGCEIDINKTFPKKYKRKNTDEIKCEIIFIDEQLGSI